MVSKRDGDETVLVVNLPGMGIIYQRLDTSSLDQGERQFPRGKFMVSLNTSNARIGSALPLKAWRCHVASEGRINPKPVLLPSDGVTRNVRGGWWRGSVFG